MGETYLTKSGLKKLQSEHKSLNKQRHKLTEEVSKAAEMGDLRENAEYRAARERLQQVSKRFAELDGKLANVRLVDELETKSGEARIGMQVALEDEKTKERMTYLLVGVDEADPEEGRISIASPLGKSLLGKKEGERFGLTLSNTVVPYRVIKLSRPSSKD